MNNPRLSIVIVSYNTRDLLQKCLQSVYLHAGELNPEIVVVDNASHDGSAQMVRASFPRVKVLANQENLGFAKANNQALRQLKSEYVLLLNPDTELRPGSLQRLLEAYGQVQGQVGILTATLLNPDGSFQAADNKFYSFGHTLFNNRLFRFRRPEKKQPKLKAIDWAHGAVMLFHRSFLEKVGLFDERFFVYGEEIDLYLRAKKAGLVSYLVGDTAVVHHGSASARQTKSKMFIQNYRSFYQLLEKHYPKVERYAYWTRASLNMALWWAYYTAKGDKENRALYADLMGWQWTGKEKA